MEFGEVPVCQFVQPCNFAPVETETIDAEIFKLLSKDVIVNTTREPNDCFQDFYKHQKKGNYRMILKL